MTGGPAPDRRRLVVLGGSLHHRGGLESFCERAAEAVTRYGSGWTAEWWPTETAYFSLRRFTAVRAAWHRLDGLEGADLVWLQWSTLLDLLFLRRIRALGVPVLVTPHLGARARLQRSSVLRRLCVALLSRADRLALLFDAQGEEIALPPALPRSTIGTFLPQDSLAKPMEQATGDRLSLIHAGRLSAPKGTFRMIALGEMLRARGIPFQARIIGRTDAATMTALTAAVEQAGLSDALTFTEWMDGPALRAALAQADILVHLSELDSFPLIVLEALAAGTVPIVADMAGAAAMVRRYGGFVTPGSSVTAAADWLEGQSLGALRQTGREAGAEVRRDHDWRQMVDRLEPILNATAARWNGTAPSP